MIRWLVLVAVLAVALPLRAAPLAEALDQVWNRDPQAIALARQEIAAQARAELAGHLTPAPGSMSIANLRGEHGQQEWEIEFSAPLWLPRQQALQRAAAERGLDDVAARRAAVRLEIAGELRELWWRMATAHADRQLAEQRVEQARALETLVMRRYRAGDLARLDANLAQDESLAAEAALNMAESALAQVAMAWRGYTGMAPPARFDPESHPLPPADRDWISTHPRLLALAATASGARARLEAVRATRRAPPELALWAARERGERDEPFSNALGVKLKIPFASGTRQRLADAEALADADGAEAELARLTRLLRDEARAARQALAAALRQEELAAARQRFTDDTQALTAQAFALGERELASLLRARGAAFDAAAMRERQRIAIGAAQSRVLQVEGVLP